MSQYEIIRVTDDETLFSRFEHEKNKTIINYRTLTYTHGSYIDVEIFPVFPHTMKSKRGKRQFESKPSQTNLNDKKAKLYLKRLINANFCNKDLMVTLTYADDSILTMEQAKKDITNYIRRLKTYLGKENQNKLKYVYVIESDNGNEKKTRIHHHIVISGNIPRDVVEGKWVLGRVNTKRLQADEFGYADLARYITKTKKCSNKRFATSQNLKKVRVTESDYKIKKRKALEMHKNHNFAYEELQKLYPNFLVSDVQSIFSDISSGAYVFAQLRKIPKVQRNFNKKTVR